MDGTPPAARLIPGLAVLVATAVDAAWHDPGLSPWTPVGLLVGVALIGSGLWRRPATTAFGPARVILLVCSVLVSAYWLSHFDLAMIGWGRLPGYLGAIAMPMVTAAAAIGVAALATRRAGATVAAGFGCPFVALAALVVADTAGELWLAFHPTPDYPEPIVVYSRAYQSVAAPSLVGLHGPGFQTAALIVVGVALVVVRHWWYRRSILRRST